jgi:hypothetical protein
LKEFYYRTRGGDRDETIRIGSFEQIPGRGGITLDDARAELKKLVRIQRSTGNVRDELQRRDEAAAQARLLAERAARAGTFGQLLEAYVADLQARGRVTAKAVENAFLRDIKEPHPKLWGTLAKSITAKDLQLILAKLVDRGLRRGVNLLRSHLHAAFLHSAKADNDPTRLAQAGPVFEITAPALRQQKCYRMGSLLHVRCYRRS